MIRCVECGWRGNLSQLTMNRDLNYPTCPQCGDRYSFEDYEEEHGAIRIIARDFGIAATSFVNLEDSEDEDEDPDF